MSGLDESGAMLLGAATALHVIRQMAPKLLIWAVDLPQPVDGSFAKRGFDVTELEAVLEEGGYNPEIWAVGEDWRLLVVGRWYLSEFILCGPSEVLSEVKVIAGLQE